MAFRRRRGSRGRGGARVGRRVSRGRRRFGGGGLRKLRLRIGHRM